MKKLLVLAAILAGGIAQADVYYWASSLLGGDGTTWDGSNFYNATTSGIGPTPDADDHIIIDEFALGFPIATMPVINSNVGSVNVLTPGWGYAGTSSVTITDGGWISVGAFARLGHAVDAVGILNMTGGYMVSATLHIGFNDVAGSAGGSGIVNLSGNAVLHCGNAGFGQQFPDYAPGTAQDGTGVVNMEGAARFLINGDVGANYIADGWVQAVNAGESIQREWVAESGWTEFTVIPEPATLGLFGLIGGGLLWFRKRFK